MKYINTEKVVIKSWCDNPEDGAILQAKNLANLPFVFRHVALMPDVHQGYGMPIGGVIGTEGVVIPNAVGVDIGCGMCACKTEWKIESVTTELLKVIMGKIREAVPVGFGHHKHAKPTTAVPEYTNEKEYPIVSEQYMDGLKQVGTLGGGNHFIEIQKDEEGYVWIMLHSGSRNIGYKVAKFYNDTAIKLNEKWNSQVPKNWELAFLPLDSDEGQSYLREMKYCVDFALDNRSLMMDNIQIIFQEVTGVTGYNRINIAHNYATMENHFGRNVMIHRKGATLAREDVTGIIPGSQGTKSYIVKGKGNPESFMSCSHGAGRCMSRGKARAELKLDEEKKKLDDKGIIHSIRGKDDLDEASSAYKPIDIVMAEQADLVEIIHELEPMAVIKG